MAMNRRIYISMPPDERLAPHQNRLKWEIVNQIKFQGYIPEIFASSTRYIKRSIASPQTWSPGAAYEVASHCIGAVIIGMTGTATLLKGKKLPSAADYSQYEGALLKSLRLPILVLAQSNLFKTGVFHESFGAIKGSFDEKEDETWVTNNDFITPFDYWKNDMYEKKDVFLGYCSSSRETAKEIKDYLTELQVSVMDWKTDFLPADIILHQIQDAAEKCFTSILLFTKDDVLDDSAGTEKAVPRDNVIFEAGYFIKAKGKSRVLIVLEEGAKMPADLGGDIYASLRNNKDVATIKDDISKFIQKF